VRKSACLRTLHGCVGSTLAERYYRETVRGLDHASENLDELQEVLEELADEIWTDLELKEAALKSRELVVMCLVMIQHMLYDPPSTSTATTQRGSVGRANRSSNSNSYSYNSAAVGASNYVATSNSFWERSTPSSSGTSKAYAGSITPSADRLAARIDVARQLFKEASRRDTRFSSRGGGGMDGSASSEARDLVLQPVVLKRLALIRSVLKVTTFNTQH
jgi:hypothetical protein